MTGPDTIQYEATIEDSKVFTKPWTISIALHRRTDRDRLFEYVCQAEAEEANGAFTREERTWYPGNGTTPAADGRGRSAFARDSGESRGEHSPDGRRQARPAGLLRTRRRGRELWPGKTRRRRGHPGRTRRDHRSAGRDSSHAAVGRAGKGRPEPARTRLRRSDRALFPCRRSAIDVCPDGVSHHSNIRLHRLSARAHVLAHRAVEWARTIFPTRSVCGRAIPWADGRATRWLSIRPT